ncbi:hypothetical protein B0H10DRAFT_2439115, partial [Mycena sp. CBHHK59/15]
MNRAVSSALFPRTICVRTRFISRYTRRTRSGSRVNFAARSAAPSMFQLSGRRAQQLPRPSPVSGYCASRQRRALPPNVLFHDFEVPWTNLRMPLHPHATRLFSRQSTPPMVVHRARRRPPPPRFILAIRTTREVPTCNPRPAPRPSDHLRSSAETTRARCASSRDSGRGRYAPVRTYPPPARPARPSTDSGRGCPAHPGSRCLDPAGCTAPPFASPRPCASVSSAARPPRCSTP